MDLNFNKAQMEIVNYEQPEMLIKGVAGSGKTLCLLFNAIKKSQQSSGLYFFTYNKTLEKYVSNMVKTANIDNLNVTTFHKWALSKLRNIYGRVTILSNKKVRMDLLNKAIKTSSPYYSGRFIEDDGLNEFLLDEVEYMNTQYIKSLEDYLDLTRTGRGTETRLSSSERNIIFDIYTNYQVEKYNKNYFEFTEFAARLLDNVDKIDQNNSIKHIYIDEAQDLDKSQLLLLGKLAKESFYIAADKGQKIYNTSFTWKEIGVNIQGGRTKILTSSYRTTEQIMNLAHCLQKKDSIMLDKDYTPAKFKDMRQGALPKVIVYDKSQYGKILIDEIKNSPYSTKVIGILVDTWAQSTNIRRILAKNGVSSQEIKQNDGSTLSPGIKLTTMHSSKGLEFDHVIIPSFSLEKKLDTEDEDDINMRRRLYYVSFTRARNMLTIFVPKENPSLFFKELDSKDYVLKK